MKQGTTMGVESYSGDDMAALHREMYEQINALTAKLAVATEALTRLGDCDWVITLPDRMDAVRAIARTALAKIQEDV